MPDLLLELFSEEIPARMQRQAADDLKRLFTNALVEAGLVYEGAQSFATPRRLALHIVGLPAEQPKSVEVRKGPRVGAPDAAIQGFLKSAGLASIEQAKIERDPKKGEFYVAAIERPGRATPEVIAGIAPAIIRGFPWPKSMRWGDYVQRKARDLPVAKPLPGSSRHDDRKTRCAGCDRCTPCLHLRRAERDAGGRALRHRRRSRRRRHLRPSLHGARPDQGATL